MMEGFYHASSQCNIFLFPLLPLDMSIDIILYNRHKIKVFVIGFSFIIYFISVYPIFCKHIASMKFLIRISFACFICSTSYIPLLSQNILFCCSYANYSCFFYQVQSILCHHHIIVCFMIHFNKNFLKNHFISFS